MNTIPIKNKPGYTQIKSLYEKIDSDLITEKLGIAITEELQEYQPFILCIMDTLRNKTQKQLSKSLRKMYFLIWMFYSKKLIARELPITWNHYFKAEKAMLSKIKDIKSIRSIIEQEEKNIYHKLKIDSSKTLFATILNKFRESPELETLNRRSGGDIILSIRCFIQCFDEILTRKRI